MLQINLLLKALKHEHLERKKQILHLLYFFDRPIC